MTDIVAFKLEPRPVRRHRRNAMLNLAECVGENEILGHFKIRFFPIMLEGCYPCAGAGDVEIQRTHVQRR